MIVLDTNVLSEVLRVTPEPAVAVWMRAQPAAGLFTTAITEAELLHGIALLPLGARRTVLEAATRVVLEADFVGRVLSFDSAAAREYARIAAERRLAGRPISQSDAQIAAIACSHGATIATRNVRDFVGCGVAVVNPWG